MFPRGAEQKLADVHNAARDVATDEIRIHSFEVGRRRHATGHNAVAESGREPFDLVFQFAQKVYVRSVRNMAVSPGRVFA